MIVYMHTMHTSTHPRTYVLYYNIIYTIMDNDFRKALNVENLIGILFVRFIMSPYFPSRTCLLLCRGTLD